MRRTDWRREAQLAHMRATVMGGGSPGATSTRDACDAADEDVDMDEQPRRRGREGRKQPLLGEGAHQRNQPLLEEYYRYRGGPVRSAEQPP